MAKQLIINAIEPREVRAAILDNGDPTHFFVERSKRKFQKGNIYRARVTSIEPHLQAAFVELDKGQHGFLGISDIILPDAGVSIINGLPAPPMPGEKDKKEQEEETKQEADKEGETKEEKPNVLLDETSSVPSKVEEKPQAIELSPVAGDMLLGLETDLNSPIQEIPDSEKETTQESEGADHQEELKTSSDLVEEKSEEQTEKESSDNAGEALLESDPKGEEENQTDNTKTSEDAQATKQEAETETSSEVTSEENSEQEESQGEDKQEDESPKDTETFLEGEDVDTAIFSIEDDNEEESEEESSKDSEEVTQASAETEGEGEEPKAQGANKARFKPRYNRGRNKSNFNQNRRRRPNMKIEDVLEVGQYITVQIIKEGIGNKAPMVSTYLSIAGHYMVLTPGGERSGVSKQVRVQAERTRLKKFIDDNNIPDRCGLIVRTAAEGITEKDLKADIDNLTEIWSNLQSSFKKLNRPGVIKQEEALASRLVRDYYSQDIDEVWIDDKETYNEIKEIFERGMSEQVDRLHFFEEQSSIFYHYRVEAAIKGLFNRKVTLPGGGSLIFDQNEAMLVIDINSGTFKEGEDDEDTAFKLNMLACKEIARQVQMRDVGGIVMIDFVDMRRLSNRSKVEKELEKSFKGDKARINIMHIGALGVLQMSRQRTKDSLRANLYSTCPHCDGTGLVPSKMHASMGILREIRGNIKRFKGGCLKIKTTSEMALELLNNYKTELSNLEENEGAQIQIDIDPKLKVGEFSIDNKNAPKRAQDQKQTPESNNAKKKRKKRNNNKKRETETTQKESATASPAEGENSETMTNRLERMEKEFPSDSLGIIKAPDPEKANSEQKDEPQAPAEETKETSSEVKSDTPKPEQTQEETVVQADVKEGETVEDKPNKKPRAKRTAKTSSKTKPAPKKDEAESSGGEAEKDSQDTEKKPKPKAKAKTASKKKAATKKTSAKKTATKTKKPAASKSKPSSSAKTEG